MNLPPEQVETHYNPYVLSAKEDRGLSRAMDRIDAGVSVFARRRHVPHRHTDWLRCLPSQAYDARSPYLGTHQLDQLP